MLLDKPYWINKREEIEYFETMHLFILKDIINFIKRQYKSPDLHPTYKYAVAIYQERLKLLPRPYDIDDIPIGYIKCGKIYIEAYNGKHIKYGDKIKGNYELIRTKTEERYLMDTRIPIGSIEFKGIIDIKEDDFKHD